MKKINNSKKMIMMKMMKINKIKLHNKIKTNFQQKINKFMIK